MFYSFQDLPDNVREEYSHVFGYIHDFLKQSHPFREGAICPHIARTEKSGAVHYLLVRSTKTGVLSKAVESALVHHQAGNDDGATILLFPKSVWLRRLKRVRREFLVPAHRSGVLLGLLHPSDRSESKYGKGFFPLRSPSPIITLRSMIPSDLEIFRDPVWDEGVRTNLLSGYVQRFRNSPDSRVQEQVAIARSLVK